MAGQIGSGAAEVLITDDAIPLGAFLKLAQLAPSGGVAKALIQGGAVTVNGETETRRRRRLHAGDAVSVDGGPAHVLRTTRGS